MCFAMCIIVDFRGCYHDILWVLLDIFCENE